MGKRGRKQFRYKVISIDPFDVATKPTPAQLRWAEWFREMTKDMGNAVFHIRRIHYRIHGRTKPFGGLYENTKNDIQMLGAASEYARYLDLIPFDRIEDHRNEGEVVHVEYAEDDVAGGFDLESRSLQFSGIEGWEDLFSEDNPLFDYDVQTRQPYHLEVWIEKSTMNDIIIPICEKYGTGLMVAGGQFSISNVNDQFKRIKDLNKPIRIFYLRDFDPAGEGMPKAVGRKIEWFIRTQQPDIDLKLFDVGLTNNQCMQYQLPRSPMDRNKKYKDNFERRYGEGATELDALESLHPGILATILEDALKPYFDETLNKRVADFQEQEQQRYEQCRLETIEEIIETNRVELESLKKRYNRAVNRSNKLGIQIEDILDSVEMNTSFEPEDPPSSSKVVIEKKDCVLDTNLTFDEQLKKYPRQTIRARSRRLLNQI